VVLDNRLRLPLESKLVSTASKVPTIVFSDSENDEHVAELQKRGVEVIRKNARELNSVLDCLRQREIQSVLVEGGAEVAGAFCDARILDKVTLIAAPLIIGGHEAPIAVGGSGVTALGNAINLVDLVVSRLGQDIEITGYPSRQL
jgi:diaminohydroxyphosphoribosylaminopyrimidine deaminase/5-amino-6-(5-phosphoribosylamino)uracil reductase